MVAHARWYDNPVTGLPTIRRSPTARKYPTPDTVKNMVAGQPFDDEEDNCPICGQPLPTGSGHDH